MTKHASIARARRFRREANFPEQKAWAVLRQLRKEGYPVKRQHPIPPYTVDFAIVSIRLVIEIDGRIHQREDVMERDTARDLALMDKGWRLLRVSSEDALDGDRLIELVRLEIKKLKPEHRASPSRSREGD